MMSVIVTGAGGFIGRHLVARLLTEDVEIYAIVTPEDKIYESVENSKLHPIYMDLTDTCFDPDKFSGEIDVMYHFAWIGRRPEARNNLEIQTQNISLTMNCMKLAAALKVKKVVFPGSTNEYLYYGKILNENAIPSPSNTYGAVKISLRYLSQDYLRQHGIGFIYTIIAGIYAEDRRDSNVIYYTIDTLLRGETPHLTSLDQLWDYVYIDDVTDALVIVGKLGIVDHVYAIGHGDNWPLHNYIRVIHELINPLIPLGLGDIPYESDLIPSSCIDLTRIREDTGWYPKIDFNTGIVRVIDAIKNVKDK